MGESWKRKAQERQRKIEIQEESIQCHIAVLDEYRNDNTFLQRTVERQDAEILRLKEKIAELNKELEKSRMLNQQEIV